VLADALVGGKSAWEAVQSTVNNAAIVTDDVLRIDNGKIDLDITHSLLALTGTTDVNALAAGDHVHDSFVYAIRLGNGTLSWATTTVDIYGQNDAPVINEPTSTSNFASAEVVGAGAGSIATGDVNGDGKPDLVTGVGGLLSVAFGNGDGTFGVAATYPAVPIPGAQGLIALADLNGDHKLDIAVANYDNDGSHGLEVFLNNGDGTFAPEVTYATGPGPSGVALGDLNDDGVTDAVITNQFSNTVSVLLGNGDGTFASSVEYVAASGPLAVKIADVNGDGESDIVVGGNHSNVISVLLGNGSGTFPTHTEYTAFTSAGGPFDLALGDFNGDDKLDIVTGNQESGSNTISILLNDGDGGYRAPLQISEINPGGVAVSDANSDGKLDILIASYSTNNVDVILGNGDGTFGAGTAYAAPGATFIAMSDLNRDGLTDIVATTSNSTVSVLLNTSSSRRDSRVPSMTIQH
jgi:VCBS repeat-containing protein